MVEVIPLKYGVAFKRVFSQPDIFKQFIFDLLGIRLAIDVVQTEYEYPESVGYVRIKDDSSHRRPTGAGRCRQIHSARR